MATTSYIYVIGNIDGPVKVGVSSAPWQRIKSVQTGCPTKVHLLHVQPMRDLAHARWHEKNFHEVWVESRSSGEWFDVDSDTAIESIETALEYEAHFEGLQRAAERAAEAPL